MLCSTQYDRKGTLIDVEFEAYDVDPDTENITYSLAPIPTNARMTAMRASVTQVILQDIGSLIIADLPHDTDYLYPIRILAVF